MAVLLSVGVMTSAAALTACNGDGNGVSTGDVQDIIKDEETWNAAFEEMDWVNLSMRASYDIDTGNGETARRNNRCEMTESAVHYIIDGYQEVYSMKNDDGTYTTYRKFPYQNNFTLLNDTSDTYYEEMKLQLVIQVSYADYFELFTFDEETKSFAYTDEIEVIARWTVDGIIKEVTLLCRNNVIKTSKNKIIYIKSDYSAKEDEELSIQNASFEYFDIGTTVVEVPQSVIDNAGRASSNNWETE
ncbi:MAG: hypothetical protein K2J54_04960 [Clostridia bacterium]|nr:hypothetical protein [Clostridia bacterium]